MVNDRLRIEISNTSDENNGSLVTHSDDNVDWSLSLMAEEKGIEKAARS